MVLLLQPLFHLLQLGLEIMSCDIECKGEFLHLHSSCKEDSQSMDDAPIQSEGGVSLSHFRIFHLEIRNKFYQRVLLRFFKCFFFTDFGSLAQSFIRI